MPTAPSLRRSHFGRDVEADKLAAAALTVATLLRIGMCFEVGATVFIQSATALAAQQPLCRRMGAVHSIRLGKSQTEHIESASPPRADVKRTCRIGRLVPPTLGRGSSDHRVGTREERFRHRDAERLCGF